MGKTHFSFQLLLLAVGFVVAPAWGVDTHDSQPAFTKHPILEEQTFQQILQHKMGPQLVALKQNPSPDNFKKVLKQLIVPENGILNRIPLQKDNDSLFSFLMEHAALGDKAVLQNLTTAIKNISVEAMNGTGDPKILVGLANLFGEPDLRHVDLQFIKQTGSNEFAIRETELNKAISQVIAGSCKRAEKHGCEPHQNDQALRAAIAKELVNFKTQLNREQGRDAAGKLPGQNPFTPNSSPNAEQSPEDSGQGGDQGKGGGQGGGSPGGGGGGGGPGSRSNAQAPQPPQGDFTLKVPTLTLPQPIEGPQLNLSQALGPQQRSDRDIFASVSATIGEMANFATSTAAMLSQFGAYAAQSRTLLNNTKPLLSTANEVAQVAGRPRPRPFSGGGGSAAGGTFAGSLPGNFRPAGAVRAASGQSGSANFSARGATSSAEKLRPRYRSLQDYRNRNR